MLEVHSRHGGTDRCSYLRSCQLDELAWKNLGGISSTTPDDVNLLLILKSEATHSIFQRAQLRTVIGSVVSFSSNHRSLKDQTWAEEVELSGTRNSRSKPWPFLPAHRSLQLPARFASKIAVPYPAS